MYVASGCTCLFIYWPWSMIRSCRTPCRVNKTTDPSPPAVAINDPDFPVCHRIRTGPPTPWGSSYRKRTRSVIIVLYSGLFVCVLNNHGNPLRVVRLWCRTWPHKLYRIEKKPLKLQFPIILIFLRLWGLQFNYMKYNAEFWRNTYDIRRLIANEVRN